MVHDGDFLRIFFVLYRKCVEIYVIYNHIYYQSLNPCNFTANRLEALVETALESSGEALSESVAIATTK
jgi:hypothetical protein